MHACTTSPRDVRLRIVTNVEHRPGLYVHRFQCTVKHYRIGFTNTDYGRSDDDRRLAYTEGGGNLIVLYQTPSL